MSDEPYILDANNYLPSFLKSSAVMVEIMNCLNVLISTENTVFNEIKEAYYDTLYRTINYYNLSYEAKIAIIQELGFSYLLDILTLTDDQLSSLLIFFNLIYILKGKEEGLKICLDTMGLVYDYIPWDEITDEYPTRRQMFTAILNIYGNEYAETEIFAKIKTFIRSYMLPWVDITVILTIDAPNLYVYPCYQALVKLKDATVYTATRDVVRVALYDVDNYDTGRYGVVINTEAGQYTFPDTIEYTLTIIPTPSDATVTINDEVTTTYTANQGTVLHYVVSQDKNVYRTKENYIVLTADKTLEVSLSLI